MVTATDGFIVTERLLLFVSLNLSPLSSTDSGKEWEVQSTCAGPICIGGVETDIITLMSCKHVLL